MKREITLGQYLADKLASGMGSWLFLIIQTTLLASWVLFNVMSSNKFDPYPFVFLNLVLSFQAAYAAPIIMMSGNRREAIDRSRNIKIYNLEKSEHEQLAKLVIHIDNHFHQLNTRITLLEAQLQDQDSKTS